jgi:glycosyltransferase involved in cell wall biosynthesis
MTTYNRGKIIGETLDSILTQMEPWVEIVVVNGASPDNTHEIMLDYQRRHPGKIRYFLESENSGFDADIDKAVGYASGKYCWLMSDDDLLKPGAITKIRSELEEENDVVVVDFERRTEDLKNLIMPNGCLKFNTDRQYSANERDEMFSDILQQLSYLPTVVIRRNLWMSRNRDHYYGTLFVHVGVIFQSPPVTQLKVVADTLLISRTGRHSWWPRHFEVWMFKWPRLVWSFSDFSDSTKAKVCPRNPWLNPKTLFWCRAHGSYSMSEFRKYWPDDVAGLPRILAIAIGLFPGKMANALMLLYYSVTRKKRALTVYNLLTCRYANTISRLIVRIFTA